MDFRDYAVALRRFWLVLGACVLVGALGAITYNSLTILDEAKASVAVVSPLISSKVNGSTEAQVSFDAIIKSHTLASLVAARMHESDKTVTDNLSVTIDTGSGSSAAVLNSPLYVVHGKDHGQDKADRLVATAIDEATQLYFKINATDGSDLKAAISAQRATLQGGVTSAQDALTKFATTNNAIDLPNRLQQQRARVDQLVQQVYMAQADETGDLHSSQYSSQFTRDYNRYTTLLNEMTKQQAELDRLSALLPQYTSLQFNVTTAENQIQTFDTQNQSLQVNSLLPSQVQVKVLDTATHESQFLYEVLVYGLGAVSGTVLGLAAIYVLALVYRRSASAEEVAKALGAPVLVRIPRIAG